MRYLEYNRKVCYVLSTIPNPNSKNPFPGDSYTVSTPYLHISIIFKYIKYHYYYIISNILYYIYYIYYISFIYPNYLSIVNPLLYYSNIFFQWKIFVKSIYYDI